MGKRRPNTGPGIPENIVTGTGAMTPEQLQERLKQRATRVEPRRLGRTKADRNASQALRSTRNPRNFEM